MHILHDKVYWVGMNSMVTKVAHHITTVQCLYSARSSSVHEIWYSSKLNSVVYNGDSVRYFSRTMPVEHHIHFKTSVFSSEGLFFLAFFPYFFFVSIVSSNFEIKYQLQSRAFSDIHVPKNGGVVFFPTSDYPPWIIDDIYVAPSCHKRYSLWLRKADK